MSGQAKEGEAAAAAHARRKAMKNFMGGRSQGRASKDWAGSRHIQVLTVRCAELIQNQNSLLVGESGKDS